MRYTFPYGYRLPRKEMADYIQYCIEVDMDWKHHELWDLYRSNYLDYNVYI